MVDSEDNHTAPQIQAVPAIQAVLYCRMSPKPEGKRSLDPIETQITICESYCRMHGLTVVKTFTDPHVSGRCTRFMQRAAASEMVEFCEDNGIKNIVVQRLDRAFRDTIDGLTTIEVLNESGIRMHLAAEGGLSCDLSSAEGKLVLTMLLAFASFEPERIARRTSEGLQRRQADGQLVTRSDRRRFGQDPDHPEEEAIMKTVLTLLAEGEEWLSICGQLSRANARRRNGRSLSASFLREQVVWMCHHQRDRVIGLVGGEDKVVAIEAILA